MLKIVTDSTAYLPEATIRRHDIRVVPLYVHFGTEAFKEGVELSHAEFYEKLKAAPELPTTSQPSAGEFHEVFKELSDAGHDIVVLTISSKLSGTWDSAMAAKQMLPEANIEVVDTLTTAMGLLLVVEAAAEAAASGATAQEVVALVEEIKEKLHVIFVVDTLEYLAKGGRIGNARAFLGTILKVKPILCIKDGVIEPLEQVRSRSKARARFVELVWELAGSECAQAKLDVAHAMVPAEAQELGEQLKAKLGCGEPFYTEIGPVIGTHTGPGVLGVAVYT
jgi:DegV family protein with EDD domain